MKDYFFFLFLTLIIFDATYSTSYSINSDAALQFLPRVRRTIFHPGKTKCEEQKREARSAYEEKCSLLGKRFCPDLKSWKMFEQWEIGGGYESKRDPLPTTTTTQAPTPHVQTLRTHLAPLHTLPTLRTHRTSLYGPVTMRQTYRVPIHKNDYVTRSPFE